MSMPADQGPRAAELETGAHLGIWSLGLSVSWKPLVKPPSNWTRNAAQQAVCEPPASIQVSMQGTSGVIWRREQA